MLFEIKITEIVVTETVYRINVVLLTLYIDVLIALNYLSAELF